MRVGDIANKKHPSIFKDELATKARAMIRDYAVGILPVTDEHKNLVGVVSRRDIMTISSSVSPMRVQGIMTDPKHVATAEDDVFATIKEMIQEDSWDAPVVDSHQDKTYRGVIGLENFIKAIIETSPEKLAKPVEEIMSRDVTACSPEDEMDNIWRQMQSKSLGGLPVVRGNKLVGIITQMDLLQSSEAFPTFEGSRKGRYQTSPKVASVMEPQVIAVKPSVNVIRVAKIMVSKNVGRVPVVDEDGNLTGVVDREDIARLIVK